MTSDPENDLIPPGTTAVFADSRLFRGLGADALTRLIAIPDVKPYEAGEVIFDEGDTGTDLFLVADGRVAITVRGPGGRQQLLTSLGAGDYFGEMAVLDPAPRSARATASTRTRLGRVDADALRRILEVAPLELARNLMIDAIHRLRGVDALLIEETIRAERLSLLGTMTAGIMHDVRNPLSVVSGVAQLLAMQDTAPEQQRWAGMLERAVVAITALVQDVLDYARGTSTVTPCEVSAHRLIEDLTELLARRMASRNIELISEVHITQPLRVDRERFGRVLLNIVANGIDAMPDGGTIRIRVERRDKGICITITDTGTGIPDAILPVLFEPFATYGKKGGTGLGMAIARTVVEAHGGRIGVSSVPGTGTTFEIRLPE